MRIAERGRRRLTVCLLVLIGLTLAFIWGNSALSREQSTQISNFVMRLLGRSLSPQRPNDVFAVRKAGHLLEFLALGGELALLTAVKKIPFSTAWPRLLCGGLLFPLLDETIQMTNDRSPMVRDIWIDFAGFACGCALALLAAACLRCWRRRRAERGTK